MKYFFLLCFAFFQTNFSFAQSSQNYQAFTTRITSFSQPSKVLNQHIDAEGNGAVEFTNAKKQVLRFRVAKNNLQILHGGIAFQLFTYSKNHLQKLQTFDSEGNLAGEKESNDEATVVFIIEKPDLYLKKKKLIDAAEGNLNLPDDSKEKMIRVQCYDDHNILIKDKEPYISSKTYWNYNVRMYWP